MKTQLVSLVCLLSFFFAGGVCAQARRSVSLDEALRLSRAHSADLRLADAAVREAAAGVTAAHTLRLPSVDARGAYLRLSSNVPGFDIPLGGLGGDQSGGNVTLIPAIHDRFDFLLRLQQPIFTGFRISRQIDAAEAQRKADALDRQTAGRDLAFKVEQAYWSLAKVLALQDVVEASVGLAEAHLADVERMQDVGMATDRDVLAVRARLADVRLEQVNAGSAVRVAQLALNDMMGLPADTDVQPSSTVAVDSTGRSVEALVNAAVAARPEIAALQQRRRALSAGASAERASRYPQVAGVVNLRYAEPNQYFIPPLDAFNASWDVGLSVSLDVWDWGRTRARVEMAEARAAQVDARLDQLRRAVAVAVRRRGLEVTRARQAVHAAAAAELAAQASHEATEQAFRQGLATSTDVLDAQVVLLQAQRRRAQAVADYALARAALEHATGGDGG